MLENQMNHKEITVIDLFKILAKRIKVVAWITLIALLLGAAAGVALSIISNATYGAQAEFYVYSEESNSYILSLLRSDSFAERLLLDENGLPADKQGTQEYEEALAAKLAVEEKLEEIEALEQDIKLLPSKKDKAKIEYDDAKATYDDLKKSWETYMCVQFPEFLEEIDRKNMENLEKELAVARTAYNNASAAYKEVQAEIQDADSELLIAQDDLLDLVSEKNRTYNIALEDFRKKPENLSMTKDIKKCVTFDMEKTEKDGKINESSARLTVSIAVQFDREFAQDLLEKIAQNLPSYVEESVIAEAEERETECQYLSVFDSVDTVEYKNPIIQAAIFGGIAAAAVFVVACFAVIIVDILKSAGVSGKVAAPAEQPAIEEADETKTEETEEN